MNDPMKCERCGLPHERCTAHNRAGQPCKKWPMKGQTVCKNHGGKAPNSLAAAEKRQAQERAAKQLATLGEPIDTDPVQALHDMICWSAGHVNWYRAQVQRFLPDALVWGDTEVKQSDMAGLTVTQKAQVNMWLDLYDRERDRLANLARIAIHAGLAEREVRLEEQRGALVAEVIRAILADLELSPEQQAKAVNVVPLHLRRASQDAA